MSDSPALAARARLSQAVQRLYYGPLPPEEYRRTVAWDEEGSAIAAATLASGKPCLVARFGSSELGCVSFYTRWRRGRVLPVPYPASLRHVMRDNAGVFPVTDIVLDRFAEVFLAAVRATDVMGVWFNRNEQRVVSEFCPTARLVHLEALNVVSCAHPWSAELAGKTVLVVHPFAKTIESQYRANRTRLFANPETLPLFQLKTLPAVQSAAGNPSGYADWFAALDDMVGRIAACDFDVAVIGAGAYGLPLGAAVKAMGRQAIHLGGQTQLLFGIKGRRWEVESAEDVACHFNEYWVRPSAEETPVGAGLVEGGCYW
ncbi:MAG: hypothetical protein P4L93_06905 [Coriobacteriia bacterium]|nr:hypothetical protein [Coriobacteriia bacterium]